MPKALKHFMLVIVNCILLNLNCDAGLYTDTSSDSSIQLGLPTPPHGYGNSDDDNGESFCTIL